MGVEKGSKITLKMPGESTNIHWNIHSPWKIYSSFSFQELTQLEVLCKQLYETTDASLRAEAEKALVNFANSPDCLTKCQLLLEREDVSLHIVD
jgi:hypothetical protein